MYSYTILALASLASAAIMPAGPQFLNHRNETAVTTTKVVSAYTTFCPEPTTFELGGKTYEVAEPTTLTITDCPCTIVEPCYTCDVGPTGTGTAGPSPPTPGPPGPTVTGTPGPSPPNPGPSGPPAPPGTTETPGEGEPMPPPLTGAAGKNGIALVGAAVFGMLAL